MSEKPEALRLADLLNEATTVLDEPFHHKAISENCNKAATELRRQHAEIKVLREALTAALENGCRTVYFNEDDDVGCKGCCDEVSYLPHSHDCWTVRAAAALRREDV